MKLSEILNRVDARPSSIEIARARSRGVKNPKPATPLQTSRRMFRRLDFQPQARVAHYLLVQA
jgi:hypothetical protein